MTDRDSRVLDFACLTFRHATIRAAEIKRRFGWTAERYRRELDALIDRPMLRSTPGATCRRHLRIRHASPGQSAVADF